MSGGKKTERRKELETILVILLGLGLCYWLKRKEILLWCALVIGAAGLLAPPVAKGIHRGWMRLSLLMGAVSGRVLLTVVYVLVLVPLSFFARLSGKVTLRLKPGGKTYFKERDHLYRKEDMTHPW